MKNSEPIRVAQVLGKMLGGGVESFIMNYYRNIDRNKVQFDFIIDSDSTVIPRDEIINLGGRIIEVPPYQHIFKYIKFVTKVFKENNYKIVHSHLNALSIFPLFCAYISKIPIRIAHSHSTTNTKEWRKNIIKNVLKKFSKVFATDYLACSEHAGRWLFGNKTFEKGKVTIIYNAIETEKFKYNENIRKKIREQLNLENKFVIGHIGRFMKQKNHEFLIDVFNELCKENDNIMLVLIGKGPLEEKIKEKVKTLEIEKNVLFLGQIENVNEYIQAMDLFAFPSLYEGLGMVLIEAQYSGLLCVASNNVPKEAKISELVEFLDIDINQWKNKIKLYEKEYVINRSKAKININRYEIKYEVEKLQNYYIQREREIER